MGYYINPKEGTKKDWLAENVQVISSVPLPKHRDEVGGTPCVQLVYIDNGWMTALGIAYSAEELRRMSVEDGRPKAFFYVPEEAVKPFLPEGVLQ